MEQRAFDEIHDAEGSWWYDARIFAIQRLLSHFGAHDEQICDVGAGYGAMCPALKPFGRTTAFERDTEVRSQCVEAAKCDKVFPSGDFEELARKEGSNFSLVTLLEVVEHVEGDVGFLKQIGRLMPTGGRVLVTVPAYMAMWSELDVLAKHYRRYNKRQIISVLEEAGYEILYASYWNMMMLIPAFLVRRSTGKAGYWAFSLPRWIDRLLFAWVWLETWVMPYVPLPFGISVVVYASKKGESKR